MKKLFIITLIPLMLLCGCKKEQITNTKTISDTTYSITADCDDDTFNGAFSLCEEYERLFSPHLPDSDISMMNYFDIFEITDSTREILTKALYYCEKSGGKYDITLTPVTKLWDFKEKKIPTADELRIALADVGYDRIELIGNDIALHDTDIDLTSIKNGFITDKAVDYIKEKGVKSGIFSIDGNVKVFGQSYNYEIKKPLSSHPLMTVKIKNTSAYTSSIYPQCFEKDGVLYHHILNSSTGMPTDNNLASVTVLGENATDCDALSTVCMLLGEKEGLALINKTDGYEAVFVKTDSKVSVSNGLKIKGKKIVYK